MASVNPDLQKTVLGIPKGPSLGITVTSLRLKEKRINLWEIKEENGLKRRILKIMIQLMFTIHTPVETAED